MKLISLTRGLMTTVDDEDFGSLSRHRWFVQQGRKHIYVARRKAGKTILLHRVIMQPPHGMIVDHINGNGLDNRRANLRVCTHSLNNHNHKRRGATSKYRGVSFERRPKKWRVMIRKDNKRHWIGSFADEIEAAIAYDEAAKQLWGKEACLNFP